MKEREPDRIESRSQRRRDYLAVQALGETLVYLSPGHLDRLPLPEALRDAVLEARRLEGSAGRRQLRFIARLLSRSDPDAIRAAMHFVSDSGPAAGARRRRLEVRRDQLVEGGDEAIQALVESHPGADRQRLRRMVRAARAEREKGGSDRRSRTLVAYLRELDLAELSRSAAAAGDGT